MTIRKWLGKWYYRHGDLTDRIVQAICIIIVSALLIITATVVMAIAVINTLLSGNAVIRRTSLSVYWDIGHRVISGTALKSSDVDLLVSVTQPLLMWIIIFTLIYPFYLTLRVISDRSGTVATIKSAKSRNRSRNARELARQFNAADDIWMISGDYSWFCEDGVEGAKALSALALRATSRASHTWLITYKSREEVCTALKDVDEGVRSSIMSRLSSNPSLRGVKLTISATLGQRRLFMISPDDNGDREQVVIIRDRGFGSRIISTFQNLFQ